MMRVSSNERSNMKDENTPEAILHKIADDMGKKNKSGGEVKDKAKEMAEKAAKDAKRWRMPLACAGVVAGGTILATMMVTGAVRKLSHTIKQANQ